jgi:hypothetical protein
MLIRLCPANPPPPLPTRIWSHITRALFVSLHRRHLLVTPPVYGIHMLSLSWIVDLTVGGELDEADGGIVVVY